MTLLKRSFDAYDASTLQQLQSSQSSSQSQPQPSPPLSQTQPQASSSRAKRRKLAGEKEPLDHLYQDIVTIYVGPNATPFYVYKELVCQDSSFFKAALLGSFIEGEKQTVSLPEDEVPVVKVYQTWLNAKELRYTFDHEDWWLHLAKLWIFADKVCAYQFRNKIVDAFFQVFFENTEISFATPDVVNHVYEYTCNCSFLRRIFVRFFLQMADKKIDLRLYPQEFLATVLHKLTSDKAYEKFLKPKQASIIHRANSYVYHQNCSETCCRDR